MDMILKKTEKYSYFKSFNRYSPFAKDIFKEDSDIVVLQIMNLDGENFLAELINVNLY